jgi:transposase
MARGDLTDHEWERIAPLLPSSNGRRGGQYRDHRQVVNGILWILRTGAQWEDLPPRYGPKSTCHDRLHRWEQDGVWQQVLSALQQEADQTGDLHWELVSVDGTSVRAHQDAAGARHTPARAAREDDAEKGGGGGRLRGARAQSRRVDHQVAPRVRRARSAAVGAADRGAEAREHPTGSGARRDPRAAPPRPAAEATRPGDAG